MSDDILAGLLGLAEESKALQKAAKGKPKEIKPGVPEFRQEYNWVLQQDVKLLIEDCTCVSCGSVFQNPSGIFLFFKAYHRVRGKLSEARRWKRVEPSDAFPENPRRFEEHYSRDVAACQSCWQGKALEEIYPPAPAAPTEPSTLEELFPAESSSSLPLGGVLGAEPSLAADAFLIEVPLEAVVTNG